MFDFNAYSETLKCDYNEVCVTSRRHHVSEKLNSLHNTMYSNIVKKLALGENFCLAHMWE